MQLDDIQRLYAYNRWANARVLAAAGQLTTEALERDLGTSFKSVLGTLAHMLGAEWLWLERFRGRSLPHVPGMDAWRTLDDLRSRWAEVEQGQERLLQGLTEEALGGDLAYANTRGEPHRYPLGQVLTHVVNHASYHRGQVTAMLRQLGAEPVATDFIRFLHEIQVGSA